MNKPHKIKKWNTVYNQSKIDLKRMKKSVREKKMSISWTAVSQTKELHTCPLKAMEAAVLSALHQLSDQAQILCIFQSYRIRFVILILLIIRIHSLFLLHSLTLKSLGIIVWFQKIYKINQNLIHVSMINKMERKLKVKLHKKEMNK